MGSSIRKITVALEELVKTYHALNSDSVDELHEEPTPLEFMRYVAKNRPFVVRGRVSWPAMQRWNVNYLKAVMRDALVVVATTPKGNADAIATNPRDGKEYFVTPWEQGERFCDFVSYVQRQELDGDILSNVKYAQSQNDNLRGEYMPLLNDVEQDIAWARIALGHYPDAINLWIGNSRSVTALHRDNYENIYCQIVGEKHFVLLPPVEALCVQEKWFPTATYAPAKQSEAQDDRCPVPRGRSPRESEVLKIVLDGQPEPIPCVTWDPDQPNQSESRNSSLSRPMRLTLSPGDMLYLPSTWYHKVSQTCGEEGICCAVNYWYDMDYEGSLFPSIDLIRNMALAAADQEVTEPHHAVVPS